MIEEVARDWWAVVRGSSSRPWEPLVALVANGIDAWSQAVHVSFGEDDEGNIWYEVRDHGEGMSPATVIESLLSFPASTRSGELLTSGNDGVGFARAFSDDLHLGVVETGRYGEFSRTLFFADGSYRQYRLDHPMDGTRVVLFYPPDTARRPDRERIIAVLREALGRSPIPIHVMGERVNLPFSLPEAPFEVMYHDREERIVLGFSRRRGGKGMLYGNGVFRMTAPSPIPWVDFLVDSPYLSASELLSTDARDLYVEGLMERMIYRYGPALQEALLQHVRGLAAAGEGPGEHLPVGLLPKVFGSLLNGDLLDIPVVPGPLGPWPARRLLTEPCLTTTDPALGRALAREGRAVVDGRILPRALLDALLSALGVAAAGVTDAETDHALFTELHVSPSSVEGRFSRALRPLLPPFLQNASKVVFGNLTPRGVSRPWFFHDGALLVHRKVPVENGILVLDPGHPVILDLLSVFQVSPAVALFFFAKALLLDRGRMPDDRELLTKCLAAGGGPTTEDRA